MTKGQTLVNGKLYNAATCQNPKARQQREELEEKINQFISSGGKITSEPINKRSGFKTLTQRNKIINRSH